MEEAPKPILLSRGSILAAPDRRSTIVAVPDWGGSVRVLEPIGDDRIEVDRVLEHEEMAPLEKLARLAALAIVDEGGERLFPSDDESVKRLMQKSPRSLRLVRKAVVHVCQVLSEDELRAAVGKSEATPGSSSSSASPSPAASPTPTS